MDIKVTQKQEFTCAEDVPWQLSVVIVNLAVVVQPMAYSAYSIVALSVFHVA